VRPLCWSWWVTNVGEDWVLAKPRSREGNWWLSRISRPSEQPPVCRFRWLSGRGPDDLT
jgi:hypothetical protein